LLTGAAAFSVWVLKWTFPAFTAIFLLSLVLLVPLSLIPTARGLSAIGFVIASNAFGVILWIWGIAYTYSVWGLFAVIIGLVLLGGGVVPIAMFAALLHGDWGNLGLFVVTAVIMIGCRVLANWLAEKADARAARLSRSEITVHAYEVRQ
jgi:membrane-anchored protein YejM (alkaline phosphatase superfamily)